MVGTTRKFTTSFSFCSEVFLNYLMGASKAFAHLCLQWSRPTSSGKWMWHEEEGWCIGRPRRLSHGAAVIGWTGMWSASTWELVALPAEIDSEASIFHLVRLQELNLAYKSFGMCRLMAKYLEAWGIELLWRRCFCLIVVYRCERGLTSSIGDLTNLEYLRLAFNEFHGRIAPFFP